MITTDVAVIGAGLVGCATAAMLSAAGLGVCLLDRTGILGGTTAGGEGNLLVSDKPPGAELALARRSLALWRDFAAENANIEYEAKGGLVVAHDPEQLSALQDFARGQRAAGVDAVGCDPAELLATEPQLNPGLAGGMYYPQDAQVQPMAAAAAWLAQARRGGATFHPGLEVTGGRHRAGRLIGLQTTGGAVSAGSTVIAAGPWSGEVASALGGRAPVRPRRGHILVTEPVGALIRHKVYEADYVSTILGDRARSCSAVVESTAAGTVLIGSSREFAGFDRRLDPGILAELADRAIRLFPVLERIRAVRAYCGFRPATPDHLPIIGPDPMVGGLLHASGHEGAGIGLAPATAELITAWITGSAPAVDAAAFVPERLAA